jgi:hypothetical protein
MSESKHTPGPWKVETLMQARVAQTVITAMDPTDDPDDPPWELATVWPHVGYDDDQSPANARLLAGSPELLTALAELTRVVKDRFEGLEIVASVPRELGKAVAMAEAAIRKATEIWP